MKAFNTELEPVAMVGQILRFEPRGELREVQAVEQLPLLGPVDFGSITAGGEASEGGNSRIEIDELEMRQNQLAQVWVHPLSPVEVEVRQDGQEDVRLQTANETAVITQDLPPQFAEVFVLSDDVPYFVISNPNSYGLQTSRIAFSGFKFLLNESDLEEPPAGEQPISIPIEKLERSTQRAGGRATQQPGQGQGSAGMSAQRQAGRR